MLLLPPRVRIFQGQNGVSLTSPYYALAYEKVDKTKMCWQYLYSSEPKIMQCIVDCIHALITAAICHDLTLKILILFIQLFSTG